MRMIALYQWLQRRRLGPAWLRLGLLSCILRWHAIAGAVDIKIAYAAEAAVTITLASLATSATWVAGRESTLIDNTSNKYLDYLITGKITPTGTAGEIRLYVVAMIDEAEWPDVFTGSDANATVGNTNILNGLKLAWVQPVAAATDYPIQPISVASLFGGVCPPKFLIFVSHSTGANLNSTGSTHEVTVKGIYETAA